MYSKLDVNSIVYIFSMLLCHYNKAQFYSFTVLQFYSITVLPPPPPHHTTRHIYTPPPHTPHAHHTYIYPHTPDRHIHLSRTLSLSLTACGYEDSCQMQKIMPAVSTWLGLKIDTLSYQHQIVWPQKCQVLGNLLFITDKDMALYISKMAPGRWE